jgi:hypothetical protein
VNAHSLLFAENVDGVNLCNLYAENLFDCLADFDFVRILSNFKDVNLFVNLSRTLTVKILFDGKVVKSTSFTSATTNSEVVLSGVSAGMHVAEISISGTSFSVTNFCFTATGSIVTTDKDFFVEGFPDGDGYVVLNLGRLDVYSYVSGTATLVNTYYGIASARVINAEGSAVAVVTQTGRAYVVLDALTASPSHVALSNGAVCAGGVEIDNGLVCLVGSRNGTQAFRVINGKNKAVCYGSIPLSYSSVTAASDGGRIFILGERGGYVMLDECPSQVNYSQADQFTVNATQEV